MELLERIGLLADTDVLDRLLENSVDRQRRATARVAVHLRKYYASDAKSVVEALRDLHRFLAGHSVSNEKNFRWMKRLLQVAKLVHHLFVDLKTAGGIDDHDAIAIALRLLDTGLRDLHDVLRRAVGVDGNIELSAKSLELIDCRGTIDISGYQARRSSLSLELSRQLRRGRRFSGALKSDHHYDGW